MDIYNSQIWWFFLFSFCKFGWTSLPKCHIQQLKLLDFPTYGLNQRLPILSLKKIPIG
jgi:hypothetical protein